MHFDDIVHVRAVSRQRQGIIGAHIWQGFISTGSTGQLGDLLFCHRHSILCPCSKDGEVRKVHSRGLFMLSEPEINGICLEFCSSKLIIDFDAPLVPFGTRTSVLPQDKRGLARTLLPRLCEAQSGFTGYFLTRHNLYDSGMLYPGAVAAPRGPEAPAWTVMIRSCLWAAARDSGGSCFTTQWRVHHPSFHQAAPIKADCAPHCIAP